ncbi:MAG: nucleotidyltransferase family protein [Clostridium sp.]
MDNQKDEKSNVPVVIMAGGKGTRLQPYTNIIPKVLIPIGEIPIVERIINNFLSFGFKDYYLTVNYKKDIIKAYFNNVYGYNINFIEEEKPLGTAGSLYLLKEQIKGSFFVTNCDILIEEDYYKILDFHKKKNYKMTVVCAVKNYTIPYGVFTLKKNGSVEVLKEKPVYEYLVNTGMYILEPELIDLIPENEEFDMTELLNLCLSRNIEVGVFPVTDNQWLDMGEFKEMERMMERCREK